MKVDIISGFLGAGKTTLIKKLLDTLVKDQKVAIVENEYGEVGIDGDLLKDRRIEVKEINSGCICCTIKGDFKQNILDIISNYRPDRIIIEPSGVANFSQVLESIKEAHIEGLRINMKITMVDAQNVHMYMKNFGDFYRSQLVNANTIILTRVEKLSDKEITHVCNEIKTINNKANIITTELSKLSPERIIQVSEKKVENLIENINIKKPKRIGLRRVSAPEFFENWGVETPKTFEYSELVKILNEFQNNKHGEVLRAKGIIKSKDNKWFKFDFVPNDISIVNYKSDYTGRVCVIGRNLNKDSIDIVSEEESKESAELEASKNSEVYDPSLKKELDQSKPEVLIYHTHNSEGYTEERTSNNEEHNVVGVGTLVAKELEENYGISVIHDKTNHSASYEQSYNKSRETVKKYINEYDDFKMVIDIHRDSVGEHNKKNLTANINGESLAKIMFVTTKNSQYFNDAESLAYRFINKANELFPDILRRQETFKYDRGKNAFNQQYNKNSMLIEVGAEVNTSKEAQATAKYIARLIAEELNRKSE